MTAPDPIPEAAEARREHFAHCVQVLGGVTATSRRLHIDERAIRRFITGERPLGLGLLHDTAKVLNALATEATTAADHITEKFPNSAAT